MATASEVINSALGKISVRASEQPLEPSEVQDAIEELNDMMAEWSGSGLETGYTLINDPGDTITVQDSYLAAIKNNLAIRVATLFKDAPITQALAATADESLKALRRQIVRVGNAAFPSTLPVGSGNHCGRDRRFYPASEAELLTEQEGSINLEDNTQ